MTTIALGIAAVALAFSAGFIAGAVHAGLHHDVDTAERHLALETYFQAQAKQTPETPREACLREETIALRAEVARLTAQHAA